MRDSFDTSNYVKFRQDEFRRDYRYYLYSNERKAVPGLFKDESEGKLIREFIGLRSKMYSIDVFELPDDQRKMTSAGVKKVIAKRQLLHKYFKDVILGGNEVSVVQSFHESSWTLFKLKYL